MTSIDKSNQPITTDYDAQTTAWQLKKKKITGSSLPNMHVYSMS